MQVSIAACNHFDRHASAAMLPGSHDSSGMIRGLLLLEDP